MKIIFDIGHPAQIYLFRNFINYLVDESHDITIYATDKDILITLLNHFNFKYVKLPKPSKNALFNFIKLIKRDFLIFNNHFTNKFQIGFGTSISLSHVSFFSKFRSFIFNEDDDNIVPIVTYLSYPFATKIFNPDCLNFKLFKEKRVLYNSYHELAYLHPYNFTPDQGILKKYSLEKKNYVILRLNSLTAHHDVGAKGISNDMYQKIKEELKDYTIIESRENSKTHQIEPWDMHHVLAFAKMIICDSQTMAAEAMVLGVPSIRINTFVGRISYLEELESKYKLGYGILPLAENENKILETINYLANDANIESLWQEKREKMLSEKCDLNQWMIDFFEKEINKS